jgi:DNA polymerase-3 subunit alpha
MAMGGIVSGTRQLKTKKGDRMATFLLEDLEGSAEVLVFPETYKKVASRLADDLVVLVKGKPEMPEEGRGKLLAVDVLPLEDAKLQEARSVTIRIPLERWGPSVGERLRDILDGHRGDCPVTLELLRRGAFSATISPSALYRVRPDPALRSELEEVLGEGALILSRTNGGLRAVS